MEIIILYYAKKHKGDTVLISKLEKVTGHAKGTKDSRVHSLTLLPILLTKYNTVSQFLIQT